MSAYFDSGFCVRQPSWHREELLLDDYPTDWSDAREKAGLLWEPRATQGYRKISVPVDALDEYPSDWIRGVTDADGNVDVFVPLPDHKLIERDDTNAVLGVVGQGFELVSHAEMGEIVDAVLGANGGHVKFETAGSVKGGAQVWCLVYLDEPYTVAGDDTETYPYLALLNAHDGSGACKLVKTQVRVVCWNTIQMASAEGDRTGRQFTFRHTASVHDRIEEAKAALAGVRDEAKEWDALATELFGMKVDEASLNHFIADFIPEPPADIVSDRVRANIDKARKTFRHLYLDSVTTAAHTGTALGLVDASVEYLDHVRGFRNADTYLGRTILRPEPLKEKAVALARQVCSA